MPCLPVVCGCCPFRLSWLSAYVLFPCSFWQGVPSLPDPTGSRLCAPPCCSLSAPIHRKAVLPCPCPPAGCPIPSSPAAALFSACSGTDPLRCHGFLQFSPCRLEIDRTAAPPSDQPSRCPGMRSLCCRCSSMSLAISWQYKSR